MKLDIEKTKVVTEIALSILIVVAILFVYDEYKKANVKTYILDIQKIYQMKQSSFKNANSTKEDIETFYDSLEKLIIFSNSYVDQISKKKNVLVYPKTQILTTKSKQIIDLTDDLIFKLKEQKLLK